MHSNTDANPAAANLGPQHTSRGISANKQNLIAMAMAAAMTPTTTTMMMPSTSVVSTPQPTGNDRCQSINNIVPNSIINLITSRRYWQWKLNITKGQGTCKICSL